MDKNTINSELEKLNAIYQLITEFFVAYSFQLLGAIVIVIIGAIVANKTSKLLLRLLEKKKLDITLAGFIASTTKLLILAIFFIIALGKVGISIGPFVAALGALSLGAGLALQGTLSNYGAGVTIIATRPFVVGDTISLCGIEGIVSVVKLSHTLLIDEDGVEYTIPNKHIVGEIIANSHTDSLIKLNVDISYQDNPQQACRIIEACINDLDVGSKKRAALVGIDKFADSGITLGIRFWAATHQVYEAKYTANQAIYKTLNTNGFSFPYPQRELHILDNNTERAT